MRSDDERHEKRAEDVATLWEAARLMRRERGAHSFYRAVADWLDAAALVLMSSPNAVKANALTVARAYLGESE